MQLIQTIMIALSNQALPRIPRRPTKATGGSAVDFKLAELDRARLTAASTSDPLDTRHLMPGTYSSVLMQQHRCWRDLALLQELGPPLLTATAVERAVQLVAHPQPKASRLHG